LTRSWWERRGVDRIETHLSPRCPAHVGFMRLPFSIILRAEAK
jgi:hypothetical protein